MRVAILPAIVHACAEILLIGNQVFSAGGQKQTSLFVTITSLPSGVQV